MHLRSLSVCSSSEILYAILEFWVSYQSFSYDQAYFKLLYKPLWLFSTIYMSVS